MNTNETLAEIAAVAASATLPEFAGLESQIAEISETQKALCSELDRVSQRTGLVFTGVRPIPEAEQKSARKRVEELNTEIAAALASQLDTIRKRDAARPRNAAAVRAALEPFRRRAQTRLDGVLADLLSVVAEWTAIEQEHRKAGIPSDAIPPTAIKLKMLLGALNL